MREKAVRVLLKPLPAPLHIAYSFAKQDAYKLSKIGLQFENCMCEATAEEAGSIEGNSFPKHVAAKGTRLCVFW